LERSTRCSNCSPSLRQERGSQSRGVDTFVREQLVERGLVSEPDLNLYTITNSCEEAVGVIDNFYSNYHSLRYVGDRLVLRLKQCPDDAQLELLNEQFGHLIESGSIERSEPSKAERRDNDLISYDRISMKFSKRGYAELISMIGVLNTYVE